MPRNVKCRTCAQLNQNLWWCEAVGDSPDLDIKRDCQYYREKTNADRIRAMRDEELAVVVKCPFDIDPDLCNRLGDCLTCCEEWLQQPVEEDA